MALAAGAIDTGAWHSPVLVTRPADPSQPSATRLSAAVTASLQSLMRSAVTRGAGRAANVPGLTVYGQTGSAPVGSAKARLRSYWFVGYEGDIAFVVVELSGARNGSAAPLAGSFLHHLKTGN
jgi:cell division protein FtsI/penicillin-binding protein 2